MSRKNSRIQAFRHYKKGSTKAEYTDGAARFAAGRLLTRRKY